MSQFIQDWEFPETEAEMQIVQSVIEALRRLQTSFDLDPKLR
jgi:hypothetical protein